jgi:hypothetical protein
MVTPDTARVMKEKFGLVVIDKVAERIPPDKDVIDLAKKFGLLKEEEDESATQKSADTE